MRYAVVALALAGAVAALPSNYPRQVVVYDEVIVTDVVTVDAAAPTPAPAAPAAPASSSPAPAAAPAASPPAAAIAKQANAAPAAAAQPAATSAAASSSGSGSSSSTSSSSDPNSSDAILAVANKWRTAYGLQPFTWDNTLQGNAQKTGDDDQGTNENHELNPGSYAQVITPGINSCSDKNCAGLSSGFELAYLSGWLCEVPGAGALSGKCGTYTSAGGMDLSSGETGHADILTNTDYHKIGCGFAGNGQPSSAQWTGLWVCDLAP